MALGMLEEGGDMGGKGVVRQPAEVERDVHAYFLRDRSPILAEREHLQATATHRRRDCGTRSVHRDCPTWWAVALGKGELHATGQRRHPRVAAGAATNTFHIEALAESDRPDHEVTSRPPPTERSAGEGVVGVSDPLDAGSPHPCFDLVWKVWGSKNSSFT